MRKYLLKAVFPDWHFDPATPRQLKLLRFFDIDITKPLTKGLCSSIIARLFSDAANKHLWAAYVFTTGDEYDNSADLKPHDRSALVGVSIPEDWRPKSASSTSSSAHKALELMVEDILKDGSPFDDPLPAIDIARTAFCFSGKFTFGTRKECQAAVAAKGGYSTDRVTSETDVLVVGNDDNPNWSHGTYGNKISEAMILRLKYNKPKVIPELFWRELLSQ